MARTKKPTKKLGQKEKVNITTKRRNKESGSTHSVNKNDREENEVPNLNQTKTSQKKKVLNLLRKQTILQTKVQLYRLHQSHHQKRVRRYVLH